MNEGQVVAGRYRVGRFLGRGAAGEVFAATREDDGTEVAIKTLALDVDEEGRARFSREARAALRIEHPNVIRILDSGEEKQGRLWLVMERLVGRSLAQEIAAAGALSVPRVVAVGAQCADAIATAHAHAVVHRDLKPSNVFLLEGREVQVKILDFGLAQILGEQPLTAEGRALGTPSTMAPEQVAGQAGPPADVYALACVLFEALTARPVFEGNAIDVVRKHLREAPRPVLDLRAETPPWLDVLLGRMLAKDPAARPDARTVAHVLAVSANDRSRASPSG